MVTRSNDECQFYPSILFVRRIFYPIGDIVVQVFSSVESISKLFTFPKFASPIRGYTLETCTSGETRTKS